MGGKAWWIFPLRWNGQRIVLINNLMKCDIFCSYSRLGYERWSIIAETELYQLKSFKTHLAALRCTFSNCCMLRWNGSQITAAYSIIGHTIVRQAVALMADEQLLKLRFRKFNVLLALAATLFVCGDYESLLCNVTPRQEYWSDVLKSRSLSLAIYS